MSDTDCPTFLDASFRSLDRLREQASAAMARRVLAVATVKQELAALKAAREALLDATEAQKIVQLVAQTVQQQAHTRIASVVSRCLSAVFDEPYEFKIVFEQSRGRTQARLVFMDGEEELDPMTASGGGVIDVASFALRLSAIMLSRPALRRVMIMDEPFKFLSQEYQLRMCELMVTLSKELDFRFLFVTHLEAFKIGKVHRLLNKKGRGRAKPPAHYNPARLPAEEPKPPTASRAGNQTVFVS